MEINGNGCFPGTLVQKNGHIQGEMQVKIPYMEHLGCQEKDPPCNQTRCFYTLMISDWTLQWKGLNEPVLKIASFEVSGILLAKSIPKIIVIQMCFKVMCFAR